MLAGVMFAAGWLVGAETLSSPPPEAPAPSASGYRIGQIVHRPRAGTCRVMLFDNETGAMREGELLLCEHGERKPMPKGTKVPMPQQDFNWGR